MALQSLACGMVHWRIGTILAARSEPSGCNVVSFGQRPAVFRLSVNPGVEYSGVEDRWRPQFRTPPFCSALAGPIEYQIR